MSRLFFLTAICLVSLGMIMIYDTASADILDRVADQRAVHVIAKHLACLLFGVWMAFTVWILGTERFLRMAPTLLAITTFLLLLVLIPGVGRIVNGSRRWLVVGGVVLQPSEFAKILLPATFVAWLPEESGSNLRFWPFLQRVALLMVPLLLILLEPSHGTVALMLAVLGILFWIVGIRLYYWLLPCLLLLLLGVGAATQSGYVMERLHVYFHPEADLLGRGHQPYQARIAMGSGGIAGRGLGRSMQKLSYLPEARNDYIAAIYGEEFGYLGMLFLLSCYIVLAYSGMALALTNPDWRASYLIAGLVTLLSLQAFLNLGVVAGLLPSTGLNLPLFSQGGSSLVANCVLVSLVGTARGKEDAGRVRRWWYRWTRHSGIGLGKRAGQNVSG